MHKLINIGCKLNQYEGFSLIEKFNHIENLVVINTCCVTKAAEIKSLKKFRRAVKHYPAHTIIATGCACRLCPEKFSAAHRVIDNVERIPLIQGVYPNSKKSRYFLKIEDGCNADCSFCIVSKLRSAVMSKSLEEVHREVKWALSLGYKEIVLVGANIGLYGTDRGLHLADLLRMLKKIANLPRIRLSSIEPRFIDQELIDCLKQIPVCRHFHIPIQSADDHILSLMGRGYDVAYLQKTIDLIVNNFDDVAIGGDIIVGFPGEDEKAFLNTHQFIELNRFTHLHVFPYSPRPFTRAYNNGDSILPSIKKDRLWRLKNLVAVKNYQFRSGLLGKIFDIVVEHSRRRCEGLTDNYIRVVIGNDCCKNKLVRAKIVDVQKEHTFGETVSDG